MKQKLIGITLASLFVGHMTASAVGDGTSVYKGFPTVQVKVNDEAVQSGVPAINMDGTTLVPLKVVSEALGAHVAWDPSTSTALIKMKHTEQSDDQESADEDEMSNEIHTMYQQVYETAGLVQLLIQQTQIAKDIFVTDNVAYDIDIIRKTEIQKVTERYRNINNLTLELYNKYPNQTDKISSLTDDVKKLDQIIRSLQEAVDYLVRFTERPEEEDYLTLYYRNILQSNRGLLELME